MELLDIKMLNTAVERIMNQEMAELGITYTQATVIGYLIGSRDRDVCQKDIEASLGLTHPTVSSILSRMESNGMILTAPMPNDRRYKKIILTDKAADLSAQIEQKYKQVKAKLFAGVSTEQRAQMNAAVQMILINAQDIL